MHFSRKCAQRPFEHICSILHLLPWKMISVATRDVMFEMVKQALEYLLGHLYRPLTNISDETLDRFMKAAKTFPIFTENQKNILQTMVVIDLFLIFRMI